MGSVTNLFAVGYALILLTENLQQLQAKAINDKEANQTGTKENTISTDLDQMWNDVGQDSEDSMWQMNTTPEQIHLSHGSDISEMIVVWVSPDPLNHGNYPAVIYGDDFKYLNQRTNGTSVEFRVPAGYHDWKFIEPNLYSAHGYYRVVLVNLKPDTQYWYRVESGGKQSIIHTFKTLKDGHDWPPRFIVYGDMGHNAGAISLGRLREEALNENNRVDAFVHIGDFAYNLEDDYGRRGDLFINRIESIASKIPYMTCPGNREIFSDFAHYRYRFSMPGTDWPMPLDKLWYSFDIGIIHFVSYSTEVYFTDEERYVQSQLDWLQNDLAKANQPSNRRIRPWIIAFGHRPMYCSNLDRDDCTKKFPKVRAGLEEVMYKYGVDLILQGHEHSYERLYPVFNKTVTNCDYVDPKAPVHIITGSAGCNENDGLCNDVILDAAGPWSAYRAWLPGLNGYGQLSVHNSTHLQWEQIISYTGQIMDGFWIVQNQHGPFEVPFKPDQSKCDV